MRIDQSPRIVCFLFAVACLLTTISPLPALQAQPHRLPVSSALPPQELGAAAGAPSAYLESRNCNRGFVAVSGGEKHSLALKENGSIVAWGNDYAGEINVPFPNTDFIAISAGKQHSLGLKSDGSVVAWGTNSYVPSPNADFVAISDGAYHSLALKRDGSVVSWDNLLGEPNGAWNISTPSSGFVAIAAGAHHSLGLKANGSIATWDCWLGFDKGQCSDPFPNTGFVSIAAGSDHNLGLRNDGTIVAWGDNNFQQLEVPEPNTHFVAVAAGGFTSLGIKADGTVVVWGLGNSFPLPYDDVVAASVGGFHMLALNSDGSIVAWGNNVFGQTEIPEECPPALTLDIRPGACPNVVNLRGRSVIPMAIVATPRVSVSDIDMESLALNRTDGIGETIHPETGFRGSRILIEDLTSPFEKAPCACDRLGPDGLDDMLLEFSSRDLIRKLDLGSLPSGTPVELTLRGALLDGTPFEISDCILIAGDSRRGLQRGKR